MSDARCGVDIGDAIAACLDAPALSSASRARVESLWWRFSQFAKSRGVVEVEGVDPDLVRGFVSARLPSGLPASPATQRNRRSALRLLFRQARVRGLSDEDPTLDLDVPLIESRNTRPLVAVEVETCREVAWWMSPRVSALWALAETTCRGAELPVVEVGDVDVVAGVVSLPGSTRVLARVGQLSEWGRGAIERQLAVISAGPLVYSGSGSSNAGQVSTCRALGQVLMRAGLGGDRRVRPSSIAGWAGRLVFDESGRIEDAARVLGVRSLDSAARMIGLDWAGDA